ncbi:hypothetical protein GCM10027425_14440 [Alteromonas gracilis]
MGSGASRRPQAQESEVLDPLLEEVDAVVAEVDEDEESDDVEVDDVLVEDEEAEDPERLSVA